MPTGRRMTLTRTRALQAVTVVVVMLASVPVADAQLRLGGMQLEGEVETGVRALLGPNDNAKGKLEEYRDITSGPFLPGLRLRLFQPEGAYSTELGGAKWGQEDQEFSLETGRLGLWQFRFDWDQTPHVYSTTARTLATETARGIWSLPAPRPEISTHNAGRELGEIGARWDTGRLSFWLTPRPDLDLKLEYTRISKDGDRPMSLGFGSSGQNFYEVPGPIEQTIDDFRVTGSLARERWQLQFRYVASLFHNSLRRLVADNPCFGASSGCGDGGAISRGVLALDPDSQAHTVSLAGGVNLPLRTRVSAAVSYSLRLQNEPFLPHTDNAALQSPDLVLPQRSLYGFVQTLLGNFNLTTRPWRAPVTFTARYRIYDYIDESDEVTFPATVSNDRFVSGTDRRAARSPYRKQNADADAHWRIVAPLALTVGTGWERWDRDDNRREVPESDELSGKLKLDWTASDWLTVSAGYRPSFRRIARYNTFARLRNTVENPATAFSQSTLLRKYDEGERDRQLVDVALAVAPLETLTTTLTASYRYDDYIRSSLGLQQDTTWTAGMDVSWTPLARVAIFGGYVHEAINQRMRSRDREFGAALDLKAYEWVTEHIDTIDTVYLGARTTLIRNVLDWSFSGSYSYALGRTNTFNPVQPAGGTAGQNANATAVPFPGIEDSLLRLETALTYRFWKRWTANLGYVFEAFEKTDWRTDTLNPFVPGTTSIFLGNDARDYSAHIVGMTLGYNFK